MTRPLDDIGLHHLVKSHIYIDRYIVYPVLHGPAAQFLKPLPSTLPVELCRLGGKQLDMPVCLHVNEMVRLVVETQLNLTAAIVRVKQDDLVACMTEMPQGIEQRVALAVRASVSSSAQPPHAVPG